jgi:hypothetical protein
MYDLQLQNHQKAVRSLQVTEQKEEKEKEQREKILSQILKWQIIKENVSLTPDNVVIASQGCQSQGAGGSGKSSPEPILSPKHCQHSS